MVKQLLLVFAAVSFTPYAHAVVEYTGFRCDGCTSLQMKYTAETYLANGNVYVADLKNNVLQYYSVVTQRVLLDHGIYRTFAVATQQSVTDQDIKNYISLMSHFYTITNKTMLYKARLTLPQRTTTSALSQYNQPRVDGKIHLQLPRENASEISEPMDANGQTQGGSGTISAGSAYDVVTDGPARTSLERYAQDFSNWSTANQELFMLQASLQVGKIVGGSSIQIEFETDFPDGSYVDVLYTSQNQQCKYVPGSAYDSHGNHIPDKKSDLAGGRNFDFSGTGNPGDQNNLANRLLGFGVPINGVHTTRLACTDDGLTGYHCTYVLNY